MKNIKLIAMDMDGTLTQHKSPIEKECRTALEKLRDKYRLLMVCAGGCNRVYDQLEHFDIDISGFYGMQFGEVRNGILTIKENVSEEADHDRVNACAEQIRNEFGFHQYAGESVEFHSSGLITFPILGTEAKLEDKLNYDPDRAKRRKYYNRVCELFADYNVFIGGTSSFDIAPKPYNKLFALEKYMSDNRIMSDEVVFFGDDYGIGGNDNCVFESDIKFIKIDDYKNFPSIAEGMV
ncbi:MAG: HAD-IIB family hydrolase [Porcipelethomonas sp.]